MAFHPSLPTEGFGPEVTTGTTYAGRQRAIFGLALHGLLIAVHLILIVVMCLRLEHNVVVDLGRPTTILSLSITTASQIIGTVFSAILVLFTQQQALHRDFHSQAVLSALHDKTTAWLGLGSSASTIYQQFRVKTAVGPVLLIFLYLSGIFSIHITTPILFGLENITELHSPYNRSGHLFVARASPSRAYAPFDRTAQILGVLRPGGVNASSLKGVVYDKTYDIPTDNEAPAFAETGYATFNATQFRFSCGAVPEATYKNQTVVVPAQFLQLYDTVELSPFLGEVMIPLGLAAKIVVLQGVNASFPSNISFEDLASYKNPSSSWVIATPLNITDKAESAPGDTVGQAESLPNLVPPVDRYDPTYTGDLRRVPLRILSCRLFTLYGAVNTSTPSGTPLNPHEMFPIGDIPEDRFGSQLRNWTYLDSPSPQQNSSLITWLTGFVPPRIPVVTNECGESPTVEQAEAGSTSCYTPNELESYLTNCLTYAMAQNITLANFTVPALESCLSQATALMAWQGRNLAYLRNTEDFEGFLKTDRGTNGTVIVQPLLSRSRLNLNAIPVFLGLGTSVVLLIVSVLLTWPNGRQMFLHRDLTNPGLLQLSWLAGRQGEFAQRVAEVEEPTQQALREAGMFTLQWGEAVHSSTRLTRVSSGSSSETLELKTQMSARAHSPPYAY